MEPFSRNSIQTTPSLVIQRESPAERTEMPGALIGRGDTTVRVDAFFTELVEQPIFVQAPSQISFPLPWYKRLGSSITNGASNFASSLSKGLSDPDLRAAAIKTAKIATQTALWNHQIQKIKKNEDPIEGIFDFIAFLLNEHSESLTDLFPSIQDKTLEWVNVNKMDLLVICREIAYLSEAAINKDLANHPVIKLLALQISLRSTAKQFPGERLLQFLDKISPKTAMNRLIWQGVARYVDESRITYTATNAALKLIGELPKRVAYFSSKEYVNLFEVCQTAKINLTEIDGKTRSALAELNALTDSIGSFLRACREFVSETKKYKSFTALKIIESGASKFRLCMDLGLVFKNAHNLSIKLENGDGNASSKLKTLLFSSIYYPVAKETTSRYIGPFFISLICMVASKVFSENIPLQCLNDPIKCPFIITTDNDPRVTSLSSTTLVTRFIVSPLRSGNSTFVDSLPEPNVIDSVMNRNISLLITVALTITALPLVTDGLKAANSENPLSIQTAAQLARRQHQQRVMFKPVKDFVRKGNQKFKQYIKQPCQRR